MRFFYRLLVLMLCSVGLLQAPTAQAQTLRYQYMHLFYAGSPKTLPNSPIVVFSPALRGEKEVRIKEPELIVQLYSPSKSAKDVTTFGSSEAGITSIEVDGVKRQYSQAQFNQEQKQQAERIKTEMAARVTLMREALANSIDKAAADGWEVVQMTSDSEQNLVYLLRKVR